MTKKSQASVEFTLTFAIGFMLLLVISGIFFVYSKSAKQDLDKQQIENVGQEIIFNTERIYFLGQGNRLTMKTNLPNGIDNFTIHHINNSNGEFEYINISYFLDSEPISSIFSPSELYMRFNCTTCYHDYNLNISWYNTSDFAGGSKVLRIESKGEFVSIDFFKG